MRKTKLSTTDENTISQSTFNANHDIRSGVLFKFELTLNT